MAIDPENLAPNKWRLSNADFPEIFGEMTHYERLGLDPAFVQTWPTDKSLSQFSEEKGFEDLAKQTLNQMEKHQTKIASLLEQRVTEKLEALKKMEPEELLGALGLPENASPEQLKAAVKKAGNVLQQDIESLGKAHEAEFELALNALDHPQTRAEHYQQFIANGQLREEAATIAKAAQEVPAPLSSPHVEAVAEHALAEKAGGEVASAVEKAVEPVAAVVPAVAPQAPLSKATESLVSKESFPEIFGKKNHFLLLDVPEHELASSTAEFRADRVASAYQEAKKEAVNLLHSAHAEQHAELKAAYEALKHSKMEPVTLANGKDCHALLGLAEGATLEQLGEASTAQVQALKNGYKDLQSAALTALQDARSTLGNAEKTAAYHQQLMRSDPEYARVQEIWGLGRGYAEKQGGNLTPKSTPQEAVAEVIGKEPIATAETKVELVAKERARVAQVKQVIGEFWEGPGKNLMPARAPEQALAAHVPPAPEEEWVLTKPTTEGMEWQSKQAAAKAQQQLADRVPPVPESVEATEAAVAPAEKGSVWQRFKDGLKNLKGKKAPEEKAAAESAEVAEELVAKTGGEVARHSPSPSSIVQEAETHAHGVTAVVAGGIGLLAYGAYRASQPKQAQGDWRTRTAALDEARAAQSQDIAR